MFLKGQFKNKRLLIFDLDGTIVNFSCDWNRIKELRKNGNFKEAFDLEVEGAVNSTPIESMIELIKSSKIDKALFSMNSFDAIVEALSKHKLSSYFKMVVSSDDVKHKKPHPEGLIKIINVFKIAKDKILFIGNRDVDTKAGKRAGIDTVIV